MLIEPLSFSQEELRRILSTEFEICPEARLIDVYKLINQACYGPTHINPDPKLIAKNLRQELNSITGHAGDFWQDIGCGRGFFRVNLVALITLPKIPFSRFTSLSDYMSERFRKVSKQTIDILTQCILASRCSLDFGTKDWRKNWTQALPVIQEFLTPTPAQFHELEVYLKEDRMPSHSETYREQCSPHYRVVHHTQLSNIPGLANPLEEPS